MLSVKSISELGGIAPVLDRWTRSNAVSGRHPKHLRSQLESESVSISLSLIIGNYPINLQHSGITSFSLNGLRN